MEFATDKDNNRYRWDGNDWIPAEFAYDDQGNEFAWDGNDWVNANTVSQDKLADKYEFDTPQQRQGQEQNRFGDFVDQAQAAFAESYGADAAAVRILTGSETAGDIEDSMYQYGAEQRANLSSNAREAAGKTWISEDGGFGDAWGDVDSWISLGASGAGSLAAVIAGGGIGKAALSIGLRGVGKAITKDSVADRATSIGAYGLVEAGMVGGSAGREVEQTILEMPVEVMVEAPAFQSAFQEYLDEGYSEAQAADAARAAFALSTAKMATAGGGAFGLATGSIAGKYIDDAFRGALTGGVLKQAGVGALVEGGTEGVQGGGQAFIENLAISRADESQDLTEGVAEAAVSEALGGAGPGAVLGGIGGLRGEPTDLTKEPDPEPTPEDQPDTSFADVDIERAEEIASGMMPELSDSQEVGRAGPNFTMGDGFTMSDVPPEVAPGVDVGEPNQLDQSSSRMIEDKNIIYGQAPETTPPRNDALEGEFPQGYNVEQAERDQATDFIVDEEGNTEYTRQRGVLVPEPQGPDFVGQEDAPPMTPAEALDKRDSEFKPLEDIEVKQFFNVEETGEMVEVSERADRLFSRIDKRRNVLTKLLECVG